ncbi:MAG: hypothetical protein LBT05_12985 [Planctomycetaceae bacterium]|jgi:hypothetical protein|nr:hypothetical protein [Planctomycetaceae bacterium]
MTSYFYWEFILIALGIVFVTTGLVRVTTRRQTEILKEYLQKEYPPIEHHFLPPAKPIWKSESDKSVSDANSAEQ